MAKAETHFAPDEEVIQSVSKIIRAERKKQGITQEELALRSNIHWRHVQRFETGKLNPSLSTFIRIAKGLKIPADELLKKVIEI